jgi:23S rRNA (adenine2030-N6)-methyltransferase
MLSYRHAFHAGNHADVLKHYVLHAVLAYFNQKDKPYWVIDTHAGAGMYQLNSEFASKNAEFSTGIARLLNATNRPTSVDDYVQTVMSFNQPATLLAYPGSPMIAAHQVRTGDKLRLFELHPSDFKLLSENIPPSRQTQVDMQDGFKGIKACLPPPTKRAVVLIDPPYEVKDDYQHVVHCIQDSLKRFSTGTYLIWYPLLQRTGPELMVQQLHALGIQNWLDVRLTVQQPSTEGYGMHGSGMFVINPPWTLPALLNESLPWLTQQLALDDSAHFSVDSHIT